MCVVSCHLQSGRLHFFFSHLDSFYFFSTLIGITRTSKLCWRVVVRVGTLVLFLILEGMLSVFPHWVRLLWACHIWTFLCWGSFFLCPFFGVLITNGTWILSSAFSASIIWFLSFNLLIGCITDEHRCKNSQQNSTKQFNNTSTRSYTVIKLSLFQGCKNSSIYGNQCDTAY